MRSTLHQLPTTKNSAGDKRRTPTPSCAAPLPLLLPPACSLGGVCYRLKLRVGLKDPPTSGAWEKKGPHFFHFNLVGTKQHLFMNANIRRICSAMFHTQMSGSSSEPSYSPLPLSLAPSEPKCSPSEEPLVPFLKEDPNEACSDEEEDDDGDECNVDFLFPFLPRFLFLLFSFFLFVPIDDVPRFMSRHELDLLFL